MHQVSEFIAFDILPRLRAGDIRIAPAPDAEMEEESDLLELAMIYPQRHAHYEWFWQMEGTCRMKIGGSVYRIAPGGFCLLPPGVSHVDMYDRSTKPYKALWFNYAARNLYASIFEYVPLGQWRLASQGFLFCPFAIGGALETLHHEITHNEAWAGDVIASQLTNLCVMVLRSMQVSGRTMNHYVNFGKVSSEVDLFLFSNYAEPFTLADVASALKLNPNYLATCYRQETGTTIFKKLAQIRVDHATTLLLERRLSLSEVARTVGFNTLDNFSRAFRRAKGVAPSRYGLYAHTDQG